MTLPYFANKVKNDNKVNFRAYDAETCELPSRCDRKISH